MSLLVLLKSGRANKKFVVLKMIIFKKSTRVFEMDYK